MKPLARWFRDLPIERKLSVITTCVVLAALLPIVGVTLGYEYFAVRRAALQEVQVQANIIRDNTAAALAFRDQGSATEVLDTLRASPSVVQAVLSLPDGSRFAQYRRAGSEFDPTMAQRQSDQETITGDDIQVSRSVQLKGQAVGWLVVKSSLDELHNRIWFYALFIVLSTLVALIFAHVLARRLIASITRPLSRLVTLTHNVAAQEDYTLRETVESQDEIGDLSQAFNTMLSHIHERDVRLNQLAYRDNVTGLFNRHYFKERAEQALGNTLRYGSNFCLMFIDLDRFKAVNDTLGHEVGDELLKEVAQRLSGLLRNNDVVCRIGGDEFAVILENVKDLDGMCGKAGKMVRALEKAVILHGQEVFIGASIGISICPDQATTVTELLRCADLAMYQAKAQGRGQYCVYSKDCESHAGEAAAH
jgi:diguanylate cyclase (GGDEF)-like protein